MRLPLNSRAIPAPTTIGAVKVRGHPRNILRILFNIHAHVKKNGGKN
jgi:hypothetical protein